MPINYRITRVPNTLFLFTARTFITRSLLGAKNFADAERILRDEGLGIGNGFSINMIWTDKTGDRKIYNAEVAPDVTGDRSIVNIHGFADEPLVHTNM